MADSYTPHYNFVLPTPGGDTNTWGTLLNGNTSAIDTAIYNAATAATAALPATGGKMTGALTLDFSNPAIAWIDPDDTAPSGLWRAVVDTSGSWDLQRNTATAGDFSTVSNTLSFQQSDVGNFAARPLFNGNLAWDAGNFVPANYAALNSVVNFSGLWVTNDADVITNNAGVHLQFNTPSSGGGEITVNQGAGTGGFAIRQVNLGNTIQAWAINIDASGNATFPAELSTATLSVGTSSMDGTGNITGTAYGGTLTSWANSRFVLSGGDTYMQTDDAYQYSTSWNVSNSRLSFLVNGTIIGYIVSDERAKENITPSTVDALARVNALDFVEFDYKHEFGLPGGKHIDNGVLAQRLLAINPNYVCEAPESHPDAYMGVEVEYLLFDALAAIQQLSARVRALENA